MEWKFTRRRALATVASTTTISLAGCGDTNETTVNNSKQTPRDNQNGANYTNNKAEQQGEWLIIKAGQRIILQSKHENQYDGIEFEPTGKLSFESGAALELNP